MWPWGHAAFGYLLYSFGSRLGYRRPPEGGPVIALLAGTQLPDLVDKPLSWVFELFPQGYSVAHSVFVAVPLGLAVVALAARAGRGRTGAAFAVGWWSHLVGDVAVGLLTGRQAFARVLWPVVTLPAYTTEYGAIERVLVYLSAFLEALTAAQQAALLVVYFGPFLVALVVWLADGAPGVGTLRRALSGG